MNKNLLLLASVIIALFLFGCSGGAPPAAKEVTKVIPNVVSNNSTASAEQIDTGLDSFLDTSIDDNYQADSIGSDISGNQTGSYSLDDLTVPSEPD